MQQVLTPVVGDARGHQQRLLRALGTQRLKNCVGEQVLGLTGDVYEVADAIAGLASALSARLREPPGLRTMQDCEVVLGGNDFGFGGLDRASFPSSFP